MMKKILIPPVFVLVSLILTVLSHFYFQECNIIPFPFNLVGLLVLFSGIALMGKSRKLFKKFSTTFTFEKSTYLISEGIYSKSRNPGYFGMFLVLLGIAVYFGNLISMLIPFFFILLIQIITIPFEENKMTDTFGQDYLDYKQKVRRWF